MLTSSFRLHPIFAIISNRIKSTRQHSSPHLYRRCTLMFAPSRALCVQVRWLFCLGAFRDFPLGKRGVGVRNHIVVIGTTSLTASYARQLAERFRGQTSATFDGVTCIAHTEGAIPDEMAHNTEFLLRALAGFVVHSNVAAALIVDYATQAENVNCQRLSSWMQEQNYALADVPHRFFTLSGDFTQDLDAGSKIIQDWIPTISAQQRTAQSIKHLKIALQCGGSDAFSGISGNPLAGAVAAEIIRYGGAANLAETPELIGAEKHVLEAVTSLHTAQKFLAMTERYKQLASWHGESAEGNPSGGNNFRGLYNIALKSLGASMKRDSSVPLEHVLDYGELMKERGFHFMHSPGNDLESIAGQVASGCNVIFFITGNGSITNFPFVPTLKIITTTGRYNLLQKDMDVNAGAYLDGTPMRDLTQSTLDLTIKVASGQRTVGENAGHSQVSIWRNWAQVDTSMVQAVRAQTAPEGHALTLRDGGKSTSDVQLSLSRGPQGVSGEGLALVLPTSLCSAQIALQIARRLNETMLKEDICTGKVQRFVALSHTEGCGSVGADCELMYNRTMVGHLTHPSVRLGLLLEHGCEKTHNDFMSAQISAQGGDPSAFGWASVQLDGGIDSVTAKVSDWFREKLATMSPMPTEQLPLQALSLGLLIDAELPQSAISGLAFLTRSIVAAGGSVLVPSTSLLLQQALFLDEILETRSITPSLGYAQKPRTAGMHIMLCPTQHWSETVTGLAASGALGVLAVVRQRLVQGHPMIPVVTVHPTSEIFPQGADPAFADASVPCDRAEEFARECLTLVADVISARRVVKAVQTGNIDFQISRGRLGVSV
eukprot:TRINITY_DN8446_c0_g3_i2.p1 TRINITY_DN8446_c0_g3~~TRINITY_DN8446_c0_g3_i2.p1  ORF type:complete len:829 (+),score=172.15 TRINITY_DN8446_c0_g3_i2:399-2885(+)